MTNITSHLTNRWTKANGYREVLGIALPLILSTGSWSLQLFIDRMFLTWYGAETIAAAMPAGIVNFTLISFFMGITSYVNTFVAQYYGAGRLSRIGPSLWQGIYTGIAGGIIIMLFIPLADPLFAYAGHGTTIAALETLYFKTLCYGAAPVLITTAMSSFYTGLGKTWPVMWIAFTATAINIVFDYLLIFGKMGFPEWGIYGAAVATNLSALGSMIIYSILLSQRKHNRYSLRNWYPDPGLLRRLLWYGGPGGMQFFLEVAGFSVFIIIAGSIGATELAATNIAFSINTLSFMPVYGLSIAVATMVGQNLGNNNIIGAEQSVKSGLHIALIYMTIIVILFMFLPGLFIENFTRNSSSETMNTIRGMGVIMLRFIAIYSFFDTLNILYGSAIKGAGDTRFVMFTTLILSMLILVLAPILFIKSLNHGIYTAWILITAYVVLLGIIFYFRYKGGKWKTIRVIEHSVIDE